MKERSTMRPQGTAMVHCRSRKGNRIAAVPSQPSFSAVAMFCLHLPAQMPGMILLQQDRSMNTVFQTVKQSMNAEIVLRKLGISLLQKCKALAENSSMFVSLGRERECMWKLHFGLRNLIKLGVCPCLPALRALSCC